MIYKGICQKHPEVVEFMILLFVSFIVSAIIERIIGVKEVNLGLLLAYLISAVIKIGTFFLLGFIYYVLIKKEKQEKT